MCYVKNKHVISNQFQIRELINILNVPILSEAKNLGLRFFVADAPQNVRPGPGSAGIWAPAACPFGF